MKRARRGRPAALRHRRFFCVAEDCMRKAIAWSIAMVVVLAASGLSSASPESVIAIDVGHSVSTPGATSARGVPEFQFNRELAIVVHRTLSSDGIHVFLIGADGQETDLRKRTDRAFAGNATFLLSIHHDSVQPRYLKSWRWLNRTRSYCDTFSGYSLFVSRANREAASSLRCASEIGASLRHEGFSPSPHHAERIPGEAREWADEENGVYYYDGLSVLAHATCPAVLLEAGIIVNRDEEKRIQTEETRRAIAAAVEQGLAACGMLR